jgi:hypothetical protein
MSGGYCLFGHMVAFDNLTFMSDTAGAFQFKQTAVRRRAQ